MRLPVFALFVTLSLIAPHPAGAQQEKLSLDWIFSDEGQRTGSLPRHHWLDDQRIAIYDLRLPKNERTIESFDARNGRRRPLVDAEKALREMSDILESDEPFEELGWPDTFDNNGRWAAYSRSGGIVLLDLQRSEVIPV